MNKIFFMTLNNKTVKASHSKPGLLCPGFEWFSYRMIGTGIRLNLKAGHGSGWVLYYIAAYKLYV
jgi:hypothetical protein